MFPTYDDSFRHVVEDVQVKSCLLNCNNVIPGYTQIPIKPINSWRRYFLQVKYLSPKEATRILTELSFSPLDEDDTDTLHAFESSTFTQVTLYKKYRINTADPVDENLRIVRQLDVLQGNDDFQDRRPFWESFQVPGMTHQPIYPFISTLRISQKDSFTFTSELGEFYHLKATGIINNKVEKFKILQLSDLHFGLDKGYCSNGQSCKSDLRTLKFLLHVLLKEKPQVVVITGDLFDLHRIHYTDSSQFKSVLLKGLQPILQLKVPFIFSFGESELYNHHGQLAINEFKLSVINFLSTLPFCYNTPPLDLSIYGKTNYNLRVVNQDTDEQAMITVLDSELDKITDSQINFVHRLDAAKYKLLFFHFPIPQFRPIGKFKIVGSYNEKHPLITETNRKFQQDFVKCGYQVISVGHEHENDACLLSKSDDNKQLWLCYSGVSGDSGQTKLNQNFDRRVRLFEINWKEAKMLSWKVRESDGKGFDYQLIYQLT